MGFAPNGSMLIVILDSNEPHRRMLCAAAKRWNMEQVVLFLSLRKGVVVSLREMMQIVSLNCSEADVDVDDVEAEEGTIMVYTAPTDSQAIVACESGVEESLQSQK